MNFTLWRREPTLILQAISALLAFLVTYQIPGLSGVQAGAIVAVLAAALGAYNAWKVRPVAPAVWQLLVTTGAALLGAYGLHYTAEQLGNFQFFVIAVMALITRGSVTPAIDPVPTAPAEGTVS